MLKRILLLISFLLCLSFPVYAENWVHVATSKDQSTELYVDTDSIQKREDIATVKVKYAFTDGAYYIGTQKLDRKHHTIAFLSGIANEGFHIEHTIHVTGEPKYQPIKPGTLHEIIFNFVWKKS